MAFKTTAETDEPSVPADDIAIGSGGPTTPRHAARGRFLSKARPSRLLQWVTRPRQVTFTPATFRMAGPLMFTRGGMFCTYVLGGQAWDFRSQGDRMVLWDQGTFRWSQLEGRPIKLRSTPMPYPSFEFARSLDEDTPHPLPDVPGAP